MGCKLLNALKRLEIASPTLSICACWLLLPANSAHGRKCPKQKQKERSHARSAGGLSTLVSIRPFPRLYEISTNVGTDGIFADVADNALQTVERISPVGLQGRDGAGAEQVLRQASRFLLLQAERRQVKVTIRNISLHPHLPSPGLGVTVSGAAVLRQPVVLFVQSIRQLVSRHRRSFFNCI